MMKLSIVLQNCKSLEEVVKVINSGTDTWESHELAAQYAYDAANSPTTTLTEHDLKWHLDYLLENGAKFDWREAEKYLKINITL